MYLTVNFTTSTSGVLLSAIRHPPPVNIHSHPKKWASPIAEINTMDIGELSAFVESHGPHPKIPSATLHVMAVMDGGLHNTRTLELTRTILARLTPERFGWDVGLHTLRYDIWEDDYRHTDNVDGIAEDQSRTFDTFEPKYMISHLTSLKVLLVRPTSRLEEDVWEMGDDDVVDLVRRGGTMAHNIARFIRPQQSIYNLSHIPTSIRDRYGLQIWTPSFSSQSAK